MPDQVSGVVSQGTFNSAPRRIEGREKILGLSKYVGDFNGSDLGLEFDVAVAVTGSQATGSVLSIDSSEALASPGAKAVLTHENAPRLHKVLSPNGTEIGTILPLQDAKLHYAGECVAVVIADTLENARTAALLVKVNYSAPEATQAFNLEQGEGRIADAKTVGAGDKGHEESGNPEHAFRLATHHVDVTLETSPHHHNAMEPGGIIAAWNDDGGITVHMPSQFCYADAMILGEAFQLPLKERLPRIIGQVLGGFQFDNKVRAISPLTGGAFGSKQANVHLLLAAMAGKLTGRPVKLILTREQTYTLMPFRGASRHRVRMGANVNGKLEAILQESVMAQGAGGTFIEPAGENTTKVYACENILVHSKSARLDTNAPGWMRLKPITMGSTWATRL